MNLSIKKYYTYFVYVLSKWKRKLKLECHKDEVFMWLFNINECKIYNMRYIVEIKINNFSFLYEYDE